jgi:DNA-binding beta-propeller fold protein YncE
MRASVLIVVFGMLGLAGCTSAPEVVRGRLHYGMDDAPEGRQLFWPPASEVPRYAYGGTLTGEANFKAPSSGAWERLGRAIAGLDDSADAALVLQRPTALVGDDRGRLFVSDASRAAVLVFDEALGELRQWERADARRRFVAPVGLAPAPDGGLYVADAELGIVARLDAQGEPLQSLGAGLLRRPTGLARDPRSARLYVADTYAHDVKVFDDQGRLLQVIGRRGSGEGEFNYPTHLAFGHGELYVTDTANNRVQIIGADGRGPVRRIGERGLQLGNLVRPKGVGVDGEGNVYVVESYYDTLLVFSPSGEFLLPIGGTGTATGRFYLPAGVWVDGRNRVHVADMFNGRIVLLQFLGGQ